MESYVTVLIYLLILKTEQIGVANCRQKFVCHVLYIKSWFRIHQASKNNFNSWSFEQIQRLLDRIFRCALLITFLWTSCSTFVLTFLVDISYSIFDEFFMFVSRTNKNVECESQLNHRRMTFYELSINLNFAAQIRQGARFLLSVLFNANHKVFLMFKQR